LVFDALIPLEFKKIFQNDLSGELKILKEENSKKLYFKNGRLIHGESDFFCEKLGVILNLTGKVSDSQYDNISGLIHSADNRVGEILVQNRIISKSELKDSILYRVMRIAVSAFSIVSGSVEFNEGLLPDLSVPYVNIPIEEIIYRGGRRVEVVNYISREYYFNSPRLVLEKKKFHNLLNDTERELMEIIDSSAELSNARLISKMDFSSDKYWEGISVLFLLGIIDFSKDKKDKPTEEDIVSLVKLKSLIDSGEYDSFSILGLRKGDSIASIQRAYVTLAQKYNPDRFDSEISSEIKRSAQLITYKLGQAFKEITDFKKRDNVEIENIQAPIPPVDEGTDSGSEIVSDKEDSGSSEYEKRFDKFERGKELYRANKFDEALILLREVSKFGDPTYENYLYLGLCQSNISFFYNESEFNLKKAIEKAPSESAPVHALGRLYLKIERIKSARKCFERAVKLEPGNIEAAKDLFKLKYSPKKKRRKLFSSRK